MMVHVRKPFAGCQHSLLVLGQKGRQAEPRDVTLVFQVHYSNDYRCRVRERSSSELRMETYNQLWITRDRSRTREVSRGSRD